METLAGAIPGVTTKQDPKKPRILLWDIETAPIVCTTWGLQVPGGYLNPDQILKDWYIICGAWKWLNGNGPVGSVQVEHGSSDDKAVAEKLLTVISEADMIVAHNGNRFDWRKLNARALYHGFKPIEPKPSVDTLKVAKKHFMFSSNKLDYLGEFLGVGRKMETPKGLWKRALLGDAKAVAKMVQYCKRDVGLLEKVYLKLRPHVVGHPNLGLLHDDPFFRCPNCGSMDVIKRGFKLTRTRKYRQYQCLKCGKYPTGSNVIENKDQVLQS